MASDLDTATVDALRALWRRSAFGERARVERADMRDVGQVRRMLRGETVDRVLTDPPWGLYGGAAVEVGPLYRSMWESLSAVVDPGGLAVVLTGAPDAARETLLAAGLAEWQTFPVLVSGKKAAVVVVAF